MSRPGPVDIHDLVDEVENARRAVSDEGRPQAVAKQHDRARMTARERIAYLLDAGSFMEQGVFAQPLRNNRYNADVVAPADGMITGTGLIEGRPVVVAASDFTVLGGSIGTIGRNKIVRAARRAGEAGIPFIMLQEGGGHRIQDGLDARHFAQGNQIWDAMARMSGWVPSISAIMGPGFAAPTNYSALADFVVMVRGKSSMGMAGPALVKAGTGEDITQEALGGASMQTDQYGIAHLATDDDASCLDAIKRYLSYLPSNAGGPASIVSPPDDDPDRPGDELMHLVPTNLRRAYDIRKVLEVVADRRSVFEIQPTYARNIVTAFARLDGKPVGFIANQPMQSAGIIDAKAAEKAAHFIAVCDAYELPLIYLIDVPGFHIGSSAEASSLARRCGRMMFELGCATVPRISIVLRKGYGLGFCAMAGGQPSFNVDAAVAWPTAEISAMSVEGAVDVVYRRDYEAAADPQARRQEMVDEFKGQLGPVRSNEHIYMDDVIDPRQTRSFLIRTLQRVPARRFDQGFPRKRPISPI